MSEHPIFKQQSSYHWTVEHQGRSAELHYEQAGFQSGWAVYSGNHLVERCAELMQARRVAAALVTRQAELQAA
ncbi:hypothetical protein [Azospirillum sp. SYSU D00513]|uniref:hypothetical protein n=1 Tax=Azospirillum sp. SYSU D00513 TaxID=2812561 RepID=UPI001A970337|nr:hypothetical protein [Azospirillum sp. SYSU D00513]